MKQPAPNGATLVELLLSRAGLRPDRVAARYLFDDRVPIELTFAEIVAESRHQAASLSDRGVTRNELVLIALPHDPHQLTALLGAMWLGAVPALLPYPNPRLDPVHYWTNLERLVSASRPVALVTDEDLALTAGDQLSGWRSLRILTTGRDNGGEALVPADVDPSDPALVQFSSGSTGLQKGAVLSHRAILAEIDGVGEFFSIGPEDRILSWVPLYHDWGLVCVALHGLVCGSGFSLLSPLDWIARPVAACEAIDRYRATIYYQPNFAYNLMSERIKDREMEGLDLSSVRVCANGAEPCFFDSHERFARRFARWGFRRESLSIVYGMAEVTNSVFAAGPREPIRIDTIDRVELAETGRARPVTDAAAKSRKILGVGRALAGTELRIVDDERNDLPERQVGEIAIRSAAAFDGYYSNPLTTAEAVDAEGWYYSGDLGYRVGETLFVTGRKSDVLILAGVNIYPQDIEAIAAEHPMVVAGRVAALGIEDPELGTERLWIVVESRSESSQVRREISRFLRREVARRCDVVVHRVVHAPRRWLLKTSSGKIARKRNLRRLPELLSSTPTRTEPVPANE